VACGLPSGQKKKNNLRLVIQLEIALELADLQPQRDALVSVQAVFHLIILHEGFQVHITLVQVDSPGMIGLVIFHLEIPPTLTGFRNYLLDLPADVVF
jgi:hypothetical protein